MVGGVVLSRPRPYMGCSAWERVSDFPVTTGGFYLFSGTYLNTFSVSVVPSDRD